MDLAIHKGADSSCLCLLQLLQDKSIDDVSTHRRAEALIEIAKIFEVSTDPCQPKSVPLQNDWWL